MSTDIPQLRTGAFVEAKFYCPHADRNYSAFGSWRRRHNIILLSSVTCIVWIEKQQAVKTSAVELGFNLGFFVFFIMCNLINKPHIQISIVICETHQFHLHFSHGVLLRSLEICL